MSSSWYVDWVPYSSNSALFDFKRGDLPVKYISKDVYESVGRVFFVCRSDGIVIFEIYWVDSEPEDYRDRIGIAQEVSYGLKTWLGHHHVFSSNPATRRNFPSITVSPVEIVPAIGVVGRDGVVSTQNLTPDNAAVLAKDDEALARVQARNITGSQREDRTAIFLLRKQYARIPDKALQVKQFMRDQPVADIPILRSIRRYGWLPTVVFFVMTMNIVAMYKAFATLGVTPYPCSKDKKGCLQAVKIDNIDRFVDSLVPLVPYATMACVFVVFILTVSMKRRKVLKALGKARSYLRYGDIYNGILQNIQFGNGAKVRGVGGFSSIITIVGDMIELEEKKRRQTVMLLLPFFVLSLSSIMFDIDKQFPGLRNALAMLNHFLGIIR